jgi:hypothetical protein
MLDAKLLRADVDIASVLAPQPLLDLPR